MDHKHSQSRYNESKTPRTGAASTVLVALGLVGVASGCTPTFTQISQANAQEVKPPAPPTEPAALSVTVKPPLVLPTVTPTATRIPSPTPWPTPTLWPTSTPWPTPAAWVPEALVLPTLRPVPVVPTVSVVRAGTTPIGFSPPDGVDVFGNTVLRWIYEVELAEDEWFDIKIKPLGSENSAFVDWTKAKAYELRPWHGWTPGLYTWQIGIVKGYKEGETKNFIADTGLDSDKAIIKWQALGNSGGSGGSHAGGSGGGGGNSSGGS